jgi:hypothetical protein
VGRQQSADQFSFGYAAGAAVDGDEPKKRAEEKARRKGPKKRAPFLIISQTAREGRRVVPFLFLARETGS